MRADPDTPPSLLALYHVERTGGTSLKAMLARNGASTPNGLPRRLDHVVAYHDTPCFLQIFGNVTTILRARSGAECTFQEFEHPAPRCQRDNSCRRFDPRTSDWRRLHVATEFHSHTKDAYFVKFAAALPLLRAAYAVVNGSLKTAVLLREPLGLASSSYVYRPPYRHGHISQTFAEWASRNIGIQVGHLTGSTRFSRQDGMINRAGCSRLKLAVSRVRAFDIVGVTSCLIAFYRALERGLRWAPSASRKDERRRIFERSGRLVSISQVAYTWLHNESKASIRWHGINASERARVGLALECDAALYAAAEERASHDLSSYVAPSCSQP